jgi:adenosylmethionine-8-amino-7-oxononanoate aminotransferase
MAAVELRPASAGGYLDAAGPRMAAAALERGVLLRPLGNILYALPPLVITDEEVGRVFGVIEELVEGS